jgi:hypothetical protein
MTKTGAATESYQQPDPGKMTDLSDFITKRECYGRNVSPRFPVDNLFIGDSRLGCKSDCDEQLIVHISFNSFVKIHSLKFTEFNNGSNPESQPTLIRLFVNRCNLGFEDVMDVDETQTMELTPEDLREGSEALLLKFIKFQRVSTLTIFIEDNDGGDTTALGGLKIYGKPLATTNMAEFKAQG